MLGGRGRGANGVLVALGFERTGGGGGVPGGRGAALGAEGAILPEGRGGSETGRGGCATGAGWVAAGAGGAGPSLAVPFSSLIVFVWGA